MNLEMEINIDFGEAAPCYRQDIILKFEEKDFIKLNCSFRFRKNTFYNKAWLCIFYAFHFVPQIRMQT